MASRMAKLIEHDPLADAELILQEQFYGHVDGPQRAKKKEKPTHYKIVCISLYNEDIEHLEKLVTQAKASGHTKANKSSLIRYALASADVGKMPKGY